MVMKVCMVCSVKGTPICTRKPWNSARKNPRMSSVTSGMQRIQILTCRYQLMKFSAARAPVIRLGNKEKKLQNIYIKDNRKVEL